MSRNHNFQPPPVTVPSSHHSIRILIYSMIQRESSVAPQWLVTVGGTAVVAATTAAWMSYTHKRLVPFSWIRKRLSSSASNATKSYYLDYNGTTPIYPEVFETMKPYLTEHFGNPSSSHLFGTQPRMAIQTARKQILSGLLGSTSSDLSSIWFTGCGTESDNMAIKLALSSTDSTKTKHIVTCNVEHPAIENYLRQMETDKACTVTRVPVDTEGRVSAEDIIDAITPDTVLVTLMLANNESGALQPVKQVAEECRKRGVLCHTDAAQAVSISNVNGVCAHSEVLLILLNRSFSILFCLGWKGICSSRRHGKSRYGDNCWS